MTNWWESYPAAEKPNVEEKPKNWFDAYPPINNKPPAPPEEPGVAEDMAKGLGTGLVKGVVGLAGLPGDVNNLIGKGVNWAADKIGLPPAPPGSQPDSTGWTSEDLKHKLESVTGPLYKTKTPWGGYAETVGEFAPGIIGGPEGLASRALTRVVVPAVASEAAGRATEGTTLEPFARVGAAVAAHGAGQAGRSALGLGSRPTVPTTQELYDASKSGYKQAQNLGVEFHRKPIFDLADNIKSDLENDGFRARNAPQTFAAIRELKKPAGKYHTIDDIESVRKVLNKAAEGGVRTEIAASKGAKRAIDNFLDNATPSDAAINPHYVGVLSGIMKDARGNYGAMRGGENISEKIDKANLRAGSTYSGTNLDNALRQNIRGFLDNPKTRRMLTPQAQAQARRIVGGGYAGNTARWMGKNLRFLGSIAGLHAAGVPGYIASHLAGHVLAEYGNQLTAREAEIFAKMARSDSPLFRSGALPPESTLSGPAAYGATGVLAEQPSRATGGAVKGTQAGMTAAQSRKESHYSPTRGVENHRCGVCKYFIEKNKCSLVGGFISPRGGCSWFEPKEKNRADGGRTNHFLEADEALGLNKQEGDLYKRHLDNLWGTGGVDNPPTPENPQGSRSSLYQGVIEHNGRYYNIPTVRDGKILPIDQASSAAHAEGIEKFPSYPSAQEADDRYINEMHPFMDQDTGDYFESKRQNFADGGDPEISPQDQAVSRASGGKVGKEDIDSSGKFNIIRKNGTEYAVFKE